MFFLIFSLAKNLISLQLRRKNNRKIWKIEYLNT